MNNITPQQKEISNNSQIIIALSALALALLSLVLYFAGKHDSIFGLILHLGIPVGLVFLALASLFIHTKEKAKHIDDVEREQALTALKLTLDNLDTLIYINEIDTGNILFINKKMAKEFGKDLSDFMGKPCYEVLQNGFTEMCDFCPIPKLRKTGEAYSIWEEHNTVTQRYYQNTDSLIQWVDGRLVHMQHSVDVTERKMSEMKIAEMVSRLEAIMANYPGILICLDMDRNCTMASGSHLYKMGIEKESIIGDNVYHAIPQHEQYNMRQILDAAYNGTPSNWIMRIGDSDYNCFETPLLNEKGKITGVLFAANDISESVKVQEELKKAMELAKQGSQAKSDFLSKMSHEIRTPMNAIIGMTKIAQESSDMNRVKYCLENIDLSSHHLLSLINDILDLSKIEANKMSIENERFSIERLLMDTSNIISEKVVAKHQRFAVFIDEDMPKYFVGDGFRLSQVLINLLSNAVKFTPEEGVISLSVKEASHDDKSTILSFTVTDTGIGITPEQQARLFGSFEQGDGSTARKYGGSGLGLVISKNIVEKMDGRIWIESEEGKGSTFHFEVKLDNTEDQGENKVISKSLTSLRVLVVDDSQEICDYFLKIMEKFGIKTDAALSGQQAIDMVSKAYGENLPYNVIFLDWRMPEMDGIETARRIKEKIKGSTAIIMISASEWSEIEPQARSAGIQKFISKPLFPSLILNTITESVGAITTKVETTDQSSVAYDFSKVSVLLVEDVKVNQEVFKALMEKTKLIIDTADNGMEAVMKFQGNPEKYDLIFMDVQMPEMDGYEATRKIRGLDEIDNAKTIPIIAMTANVFKEDIDKCLEAGMNSHLGKPIDREKILEKIRIYAKSSAGTIVKEETDNSQEKPADTSMLPYLDLEDLKNRLGADDDVCKALLRSFLDNGYAQELREIVEEGDMNKAREVIHTIKGVASNLSLTELHKLSVDCENKIKRGVQQTEDFKKIEQTMSATKEIVQKFVNN